jgi:signal peptidase I
MGYLFRKDKNDQKGKWSDVFKSLALIILLYMTFRWILWEPFVIPSSSMETTLLVQDYVLVQKWAYGLRVPFTERWLWGPRVPKRGDIVVFKAKDQSGHFLVKRVVGLPGDILQINEQGHILVNSQSFVYNEQRSDSTDFIVFDEHNGDKSYRVQFLDGVQQKVEAFEVPEDHIFMMGDNRNQSSDSRYWGALPMDKIMGKLDLIWLSCKESDKHSSFLCPPADFRHERIFKRVQ